MSPDPRPRYLELAASGELDERVRALRALLGACRVCPRACGVDRLADDAGGRCGTGRQVRLASSCAHRGEEPVISGTRGAGTLFFAGCNLRGVFCQNHEIRQPCRERRWPRAHSAGVAEAMLDLQAQGVHSIELVSPSHVVPQAVEALGSAAARGLALPLVYNSNGYEGGEALRLLDGVVDVYLPDLKYGDDALAARYSGVTGYLTHALPALREMKRQVGDLALGDDGVARRGLLVRHLVLPSDLSATRTALRLIAAELGPATHVSVMAQYYPAHRAPRVPLLCRPLRPREYERVLEWLDEAGLEHGFVQELEAESCYRPDFGRDGHPFEG
ncbi:MAG: radical SAM protein [Deltaproteobacteria bacterium]|nr:radical SAM protein [Deltaproteobacteria bacterium]